MNPRSIILVVVALVVAGLAAFLARGFISANQPQQAAQTAPVGPKILVASINLPIGHIMEAKDLRWQSWPDSNVSDNYLREGATTVQKVVGYVVRHSITVGEPITRVRIVAPSERGFVAAALGPGMRAITIPINRSSGLAGLLFPGDRVDVLLTHTITDDNGIVRQVGETVFQNIRILAIDARTDDQTNKPAAGKTATLEVTPKMAEKVAVVQRLGALSLILRSLTRPDGVEIASMERDESMPISGAQTYTFDAEVSALRPPLDLGDSKQLVIISKGNQSQLVEFKRKEQ